MFSLAHHPRRSTVIWGARFYNNFSPQRQNPPVLCCSDSRQVVSYQTSFVFVTNSQEITPENSPPHPEAPPSSYQPVVLQQTDTADRHDEARMICNCGIYVCRGTKSFPWANYAGLPLVAPTRALTVATRPIGDGSGCDLHTYWVLFIWTTILILLARSRGAAARQWGMPLQCVNTRLINILAVAQRIWRQSLHRANFLPKFQS